MDIKSLKKRLLPCGLFKFCWLLFLVLPLFVGCTEYVDLNLGSIPPRFVVDGRITTDTTTHYVKLSLTADFFSNEKAPVVSGARVTLDDGFSKLLLEEWSDGSGVYFTPPNYNGVPGRTYHLKIENVDVDQDGVFELYEAQSTMPDLLHIDSIGYSYIEKDKLWRVLFYARDNPDRDDFYMFSVAKNDSLVSDQYSETICSDDKFFNGNYAYGAWVQNIRKENEDGDVVITLKKGDWITLFVSGITEPFYEYVMALSDETGYKNPVFSGPPANIKGNVSNGALGYFTTYSVISAKVMVREDYP